MAGILLPIASLIGGLLSSVVGTFVSGAVSDNAMERQAEINQQGVDTANRYNLPINQVDRLRQAGLNANLLYGNGSVAGLTSSGTASTNQGFKSVPFNLGVSDAVETYMQGKQIDQSVAESKSRQLLLAQQVKESMSREQEHLVSANFDSDTYWTRKHQLERQNTLIEKTLDKMAQEMDESYSRQRVNEARLGEIYANIKYLAAREGLTTQQAETEVKRRFVMDAQEALYRSNIEVNKADLELIAERVLNVRQDTSNKTLWHELQELEKNSRGALKQLLADHSNWAVFYAILKDIFGGGIGLSYRF